LAAERARLSPPEPLSFLRAARLPSGFKPRGSPDSPRTARARVDRHLSSRAHQGRLKTSALRVVRKSASRELDFMTQLALRGSRLSVC
jgi:hypothetical protein